MREVCFIADVAVLPRWLRVSQALDYVAGVHPRFDRAKAEAFLAKTSINKRSKVGELSKGMPVVQAAMALVMAIDAKLLVLDEAMTSGLDILYRKRFYDSLLSDFFDGTRTIVVTTHEVAEIQDVLTDLAFIDRGRVVLRCSHGRVRGALCGTSPRAAGPGGGGERRSHPSTSASSSGAPWCRLRRRGPRAPLARGRGAHPGRGGALRGDRGRRGREGGDAMNAFLWSLRREDLGAPFHLGVAPLIVAGVVLVGFLVNKAGIDAFLTLPALDPQKQLTTAVLPFSLAAAMILLASFVVGAIYSGDAMLGERRDRSILFWRSMPVTDLTAVLAKAAIPIVVIPVISLAVVLVTQAVMLVFASIGLVANSFDPAGLWAHQPMLSMTIALVYAVAVHALWFAPVYAWLLLVSSWAKRAVFAWAALPFFAWQVIELLALRKDYVVPLVKYRIAGAMSEAFVPEASIKIVTRLGQLDPARFLSSPGLWLGLAFAAACVAGAVRMRRYREAT